MPEEEGLQGRDWPAFRLGTVAENHPGGISIVQRRPQGQRLALAVRAVGIAGADEIDPVVAHVPRQVVVLAGEGPPALGQGLEEEPQVHGMEGAHVIPAGDLRIEVVVVQGLVGAGGDVHLARRTQRQLNGADGNLLLDFLQHKVQMLFHLLL